MLLDLCDVESKVAAAQRADQGRPDRWARRGRAGHGRAGRQGPRGAWRPRPRADGDDEDAERHHRRTAVAAARIHAGAAAGVGRPRRRPGRPGGHRRWRRTRPVRLVAHPLRDGGRRRAVGRRCARAGLDHRADQVGGRPEAGLVRHRRSGDLVDEAELVERYHDAVVERCGIREFVDDGAIDPDHASPLLVSVFLDKDFTFVVSSARPTRGRSSSSTPSTPWSGRCPTPATGR